MTAIPLPSRLLALAAALSLAGCVTVGDAEIGRALDERLGSLESEAPAEVPTGALRPFYERRGYQPVWVGADGFTASGEALVETVCRPAPRRLHDDDLDAIARDFEIAYSDEGRDASARAAAVASLEIELSRAAVALRRDVERGLANLPAVQDDWHYEVAKDPDDPADILARLAAADDVARAIHAAPEDHPPYDRLARALERYRRIADEGGWRPIPPGPELRPTGDGPRVEAVRARLLATGDLVDPGGDLAEAVRSFRDRHGLTDAARIDDETLAAMNVPVEERIATLEVNLERQRLLPPDTVGRRIVVNVPDFTLRAYDDDGVALEMAVIVGEKMNRTPIFGDRLEYVTFRPYWNVPESIAVEELLPKIAERPSFLADSGYEVVDVEDRVVRSFRVRGRAVEIDGGGEDGDEQIAVRQAGFLSRLGDGDAPDLEEGILAGELRIRQRPGPSNALGLIKFMFPNRFNVYLHDTPADSLFGATSRDFSHGCVRVEEPVRLASYVLAGNGGWSAEEIVAAMRDEEAEARDETLATPIPVSIVYLTAWADPGGRVHFRNDVYGLDAAVREALRADGRPASVRRICERLLAGFESERTSGSEPDRAAAR